MAKTLNAAVTILTDQSIAAGSTWEQSTSLIDVETLKGIISFELKVKGSSVALTDDVVLYVRKAIDDGTTLSDTEHSTPIGVINSAGTTYEVQVDKALEAFAGDETIGFAIENKDDTNAATVSLKIRSSNL